jgi:hypothetical protein
MNIICPKYVPIVWSRYSYKGKQIYRLAIWKRSLSLSSQSLNKIMREIIRPEDTTERDEQWANNDANKSAVHTNSLVTHHHQRRRPRRRLAIWKRFSLSSLTCPRTMSRGRASLPQLCGPHFGHRGCCQFGQPLVKAGRRGQGGGSCPSWTLDDDCSRIV